MDIFWWKISIRHFFGGTVTEPWLFFNQAAISCFHVSVEIPIVRSRDGTRNRVPYHSQKKQLTRITWLDKTIGDPGSPKLRMVSWNQNHTLLRKWLYSPTAHPLTFGEPGSLGKHDQINSLRQPGLDALPGCVVRPGTTWRESHRKPQNLPLRAIFVCRIFSVFCLVKKDMFWKKTLLGSLRTSKIINSNDVLIWSWCFNSVWCLKTSNTSIIPNKSRPLICSSTPHLHGFQFHRKQKHGDNFYTASQQNSMVHKILKSWLVTRDPYNG